MDADGRHLRSLSEFLLKQLRAAFPGLEVNGALTPRLPGSLNIRIPGVCAEDILLGLTDDLGCQQERLRIGPPEPSPVLRAIGLSDEAIAVPSVFPLAPDNTGRCSVRSRKLSQCVEVEAAADFL